MQEIINTTHGTLMSQIDSSINDDYLLSAQRSDANQLKTIQQQCQWSYSYWMRYFRQNRMSTAGLNAQQYSDIKTQRQHDEFLHNVVIPTLNNQS